MCARKPWSQGLRIDCSRDTGITASGAQLLFSLLRITQVPCSHALCCVRESLLPCPCAVQLERSQCPSSYLRSSAKLAGGYCRQFYFRFRCRHHLSPVPSATVHPLLHSILTALSDWMQRISRPRAPFHRPNYCVRLYWTGGRQRRNLLRYSQVEHASQCRPYQAASVTPRVCTWNPTLM